MKHNRKYRNRPKYIVIWLNDKDDTDVNEKNMVFSFSGARPIEYPYWKTEIILKINSRWIIYVNKEGKTNKLLE